MLQLDHIVRGVDVFLLLKYYEGWLLWMIKIREISDDRGWKILEGKLRQEGLSEREIRLAESSFREGLEILKQLFIQSHSLKKSRKRQR